MIDFGAFGYTYFLHRTTTSINIRTNVNAIAIIIMSLVRLEGLKFKVFAAASSGDYESSVELVELLSV